MPLSQGGERAFRFYAGGFVEKFLGEDVLRDEDEGAAEGAKDAEDVAGKLDAASENYSQGKGNKGEVGGSCVVYAEEDAVGKDREKRRQAFDGVN